MSGRILGVDYGTKRVGLAIADPLHIASRPLGTFSPDAAVDELRRLHAVNVIATLVVGLPLMPDGTEGDSARRAREYANRLRNAFRDVEVVLWDERHSSEMARSVRADTSVSKRSDPGLDAIAASILLQDYLER